MQGFLTEVAQDLYRRYGDDVSSLYILFPSQRARLFFTDALSSVARRPMWQPHWLTIDDLMCEISGLESCDRIRLIAELYKVYTRHHEEPFDRFYFWGDMMLTDFDTVDKYLIDAGALFSNIKDLKELESDLSYLSPEQRMIVENFWRSFSDGGEDSVLKQQFIGLWRSLPKIYGEFRESLSAQGIAYTGMIHRTAVDRMREGTVSLPERRYVVAGFNALSACEKRLFDYLKSSAGVDFYWDYDDYYTSSPEQEAGLFVRENTRLYPAAAEISHDNFRNTEKRVTVVSTVSNVLQCKYVSEVLAGLAKQRPLDKDTAIVLTDENLLEPMMYSMPGEVETANITMGYPLMLTPACSFVERLLDLQNRSRMKGGEAQFYHADAENLLMHPYVSDNDEAVRLVADIRRNREIMVPASRFSADGLLNCIFRRVGSAAELSDYLVEAVSAVAKTPCSDDPKLRMEYLSSVVENVCKLRNSIAGCGIEVGLPIYGSLLRRHLRTVRIPFRGEPLNGVQIMGILETRNLDFRNVIVLSMDDNNFPGNRISQSSFIPPNLRFAYGMPTAEHHEGVYAYYFYRLIQRCENLYMVYCSHADDKSTGEQSRYIRQLEYESGLEINKVEVGVDVSLFEGECRAVEKSGRTAEVLRRYLDKRDPLKISPTAFSRFIECELKFWYRHIARIQPDNEIADMVDNRVFGNIFHKASENIYSRIKDRFGAGEELLRAMDVADEEIVKAINSEYLHDENADPANYDGDIVLVRELLTGCLRNVLKYDAAHDRFAVQALEAPVKCRFPFVMNDGSEAEVCFEGDSDRIDLLEDGTIRIVDYKTGRKELTFAGISELFAGAGGDYNVNVIKTLMYAMMVDRTSGCKVLPTLYFVRSMGDENYSPLLIRKSREGDAAGELYAEYRAAFEDEIRKRLVRLFDFSVPFKGCDETHTCTYCDYRSICNR